MMPSKCYAKMDITTGRSGEEVTSHISGALSTCSSTLFLANKTFTGEFPIR